MRQKIGALLVISCRCILVWFYGRNLLWIASVCFNMLFWLWHLRQEPFSRALRFPDVEAISNIVLAQPKPWAMSWLRRDMCTDLYWPVQFSTSAMEDGRGDGGTVWCKQNQTENNQQIAEASTLATKIILNRRCLPTQARSLITIDPRINPNLSIHFRGAVPPLPRFFAHKQDVHLDGIWSVQWKQFGHDSSTFQHFHLGGPICPMWFYETCRSWK